MRFRLIYDGPLKAAQRDVRGGQVDRRAPDKNAIRRQFHPQLRELWHTHEFLSTHQVYPGDYALPKPGDGAVWGAAANEKIPLRAAVAELHVVAGRRFIPLVRKKWALRCQLSVLFLRPSAPGSLWGSSGDLDNRIKTLVDGLRLPRSEAELSGIDEPTPADEPFYCLLEDDDDITSVAVETDRLLMPHPTKTDADRMRVHAVITVEVRPHEVTMFNLGLG